MGSVDWHLELIMAKNGQYSLRMRTEEGTVKTLHSLYDPQAEARTMVEAFHYNGSGLLVVLGLGLGYHVVELCEKFPSANIIVVEMLSDIYEAAKKHGSISGLPDRVAFIVGRSTHELLGEIMEIQGRPGMSPISVFSFSPVVSTFNQYYDHIAISTLKSRATRSDERLLYPKFQGKILRICIADLNYFLNREADETLRGMGHSVCKIRMRKGEEAGSVVRRMMETVLDFKPDFILAINHIGFDKQGELTAFFKTIKMPVAAWYVDSPNLILKAYDGNVSPYVSLFVWDRSYIGELLGMGFEDVSYLPLAADELLFKPIKLSKSEKKRYGSEVAFVGHSMVAETQAYLDRVPAIHYPLIEKVAGQLVLSRATFDDALKTVDESELEKIRAFSVEERVALEAATLWKATLLYRLSCVKHLGEFRPTIYGDQHWQKLLGPSFQVRPSLHYYKELPLFYNASLISLNATNFQMFEAVNQRVFDAPACGGFLITDRQQVLDELFEVGTEMISYHHRDEIQELVRFYLRNEKVRETVSKRGRERVLKEHTYVHRLTTLIDRMKKRYQSC